MSARVKTTILVQELVAALNRGDGYIMGAYGQNPRTGYLDLSVPESQCKSSWKPNGHYFSQYDDNAKQHKQALVWREKCTRVWDCNGLAEGIYELQTGTCINSKARHNYVEWCGTKGAGMIPAQYRVPGAAVFWSSSPKSNPSSDNIHHVAYLWKPVIGGKPEGDWYLIEAQGVMKGVVKSKLYSRKPNFWGIMDKYYDYSDSDIQSKPVPVPIPTGDAPDISLLGKRILKKGSEGDDVKQMQAALMWLGYDLGKYGADGDFGSATDNAVKAFQKDFRLDVDGEFGPKSLAALKQAIRDAEDAKKDTEPGTEPPTPEPKQDKIEITGGSVNVRSAPGAENTRVLGVVHRGDKLPWQGLDSEVGDTKWYMVEYKNQNGWVSGKYSRVV